MHRRPSYQVRTIAIGPTLTPTSDYPVAFQPLPTTSTRISSPECKWHMPTSGSLCSSPPLKPTTASHHRDALIHEPLAHTEVAVHPGLHLLALAEGGGFDTGWSVVLEISPRRGLMRNGERERMGGETTYVRPVLLLTPARKAEMRTASKAMCVRRPSYCICSAPGTIRA